MADTSNIWNELVDKVQSLDPGFTPENSANKDTDGTLAANSDSRYPSQKAVRTFVQSAVTGLLDFKGATSCSSNPNYPAASNGDAYIVSAAGKIGGASGKSVDVGDVYVASADNAGGTEASVGTSWFVLEHNLAGALLSANNLSDVANASTARANLGLEPLEKDYLGGLHAVWNSGTSITFKAGSAYVEGSAAILVVSADVTKSGLSLSSNTWYHAYLYSNSGTPDVEIVTTAPAAAYFGEARSKTGDNTRRYLFSLRTNGGSNVYAFRHSGNLVRYLEPEAASPFQVLAGGTATSETNVDCSAVVPLTARLVQLKVTNFQADKILELGVSDDNVTGGSGNNGMLSVSAPAAGSAVIFVLMFPVDASQIFTYWYRASLGSGGAYIDLLAYEPLR